MKHPREIFSWTFYMRAFRVPRPSLAKKKILWQKRRLVTGIRVVSTAPMLDFTVTHRLVSSGPRVVLKSWSSFRVAGLPSAPVAPSCLRYYSNQDNASGQISCYILIPSISELL